MNKKGFTLIELLAIIVILAIIAVITVPLILGIIDDASKNAAISSAYGYKDSINKYYATKMLQDSNYTIPEGTYYVNGDTGYLERNSETLAIALSGRTPSLGSVKIGRSGEVEEMQLCINNYMVSFKDGEDITAVKGCTPVEPGLYDMNNVLVASYDDLVSTYGFDPSIDSDSGDETREILANYSNGVKLVLPDTVTEIGESAFQESNLLLVVIPSSVTSIGDWAFWQAKLTSLTIPSSVISIGEGSFSDCQDLESVTFESGSQLTSIGDMAFDGVGYGDYDNVGLTSITVPSSVTSIGQGAFWNIVILNYEGSAEDTDGDNWGAIVLNPYVEGDFVYSDNTKTTLEVYLGSSTTVTVPSSVTSIKENAFYPLDMVSVTVPSSVTSIDEDAFNFVKVVYYTGSAEDTGGNDWGATSLNPYIEGDFGYSDNTKTTLEVYLGSSASVTVPSSVTSIGYRAFLSSNLTSIVIPSSVTSIDDQAFRFCHGLTNITFESGSHLTRISSSSFDYSGLTSITIPSSVTSIGDYAFSGCKNLTSVSFESGSHLTSIERYAFFNVPSLTSITIPASVTSIGVNAFWRVGTVYYNGSASGSPWGATQVIRN